jgi:hypothetical protein
MEVLQTSALPLGYGARQDRAGWRDPQSCSFAPHPVGPPVADKKGAATTAHCEGKDGAGNGIRTRDFDLGKVALYH